MKEQPLNVSFSIIYHYVYTWNCYSYIYILHVFHLTRRCKSISAEIVNFNMFISLPETKLLQPIRAPH